MWYTVLAKLTNVRTRSARRSACPSSDTSSSRLRCVLCIQFQRLRFAAALVHGDALRAEVVLRLCDFLCGRESEVQFCSSWICSTFMSSVYASGVSLNVYSPFPNDHSE